MDNRIMTEEELENRVKEIIRIGEEDPEAAHSDEDNLRLELIGNYCPDWVVKEIDKLSNADFPRWCA